MKILIEAIQIAESFNIKKFRSEFRTEAFAGSTSEIFYALENNRYLFIFDYGVMVLANYDTVSKSELVNFVKNYAVNTINEDLNEEYELRIDENQDKPIVKNDHMIASQLEPDLMRVIMLNVGQSVALEYYETLTDVLITSSKLHIVDLEKNGKINISKTNLLKHIGKALNVKNSIVDNLYILDDPNLVWDNETLNLLNRQLKINFDINTRFKDLDYRLQIVENNLRLFTEVLNVRDSARLEWIVIILILIEVLNTLFFH